MTTELEAFKIHLNIIDGDDTLPDALLQQKLDVAAALVDDITGGTVSPAPANVAEAIRMLAAHLVLQREATIAGATLEEIPFGVMRMLDAHRYWPGQRS